MKHNVKFEELKKNDIILTKCQDEYFSGIVVSKEQNSAGNFIYVKFWHGAPAIIYVDDFLAEKGHECYNPYSILRILGNTENEQDGVYVLSYLSQTPDCEDKAGVYEKSFKTLDEAEEAVDELLKEEFVNIKDMIIGDEDDYVEICADCGVVHNSDYSHYFKVTIAKVTI